MKKECKQCSGCAFLPNTDANNETVSSLKADIAVLTPSPFYCHSTMENWKEVSSDADRKELIENGMKICEGWKKAVKEVAETGYYENTTETKFYGKGSALAFELWMKEKDSETKKNYLEVVQFSLKKLVERAKVYGANKFLNLVKKNVETK